MDYGRGESNAIAIIPEAWADPSSDHDPDYPVAAVEPPARKPRAGPSAGESSRAIGRMFFKTKLCCKFRAGTCPYPTNCNFAHGVQELRRPPPNWEEIVAAHHEASDPPPPTQQQREEHHTPIITPSSGGGNGQCQRSYKGRRCKKFYTDETCPYGDTCSFLHDEQPRSRDSVAISLSPVEGGCGGGGGIQKPSNWKTRMCNKWEISGYCPFGTKCHFAHGAAELPQYGGGLVETEGRDAALVSDSKQSGVLSKAQTNTALRSGISVPHVDNYQTGFPSNRLTAINPRQGQTPPHIWKGPDKISRIYGDWIDNLE